jgi:hypothetical protein
MRSIVLHYHLFKNAGSSVNAILKKNFRRRWLNGEFGRPPNFAAVAEWIVGHPHIKAFSSHTAQLPMPVLEDIEIIPILFVRHPIDRIRSAYHFNRKLPPKETRGQLAKVTGLADYVRIRLANKRDRQCRNMQTARLGRVVLNDKNCELDTAIGQLERLPFVGVVERFDESVQVLEHILRPRFPEFRAYSARANTSAAVDVPLNEKLEKIREEIGADLYGELLQANMKDICLHAAANVRLDEQLRAVQAAAQVATN